jgi:hypothetical protein
MATLSRKDRQRHKKSTGVAGAFSASFSTLAGMISWGLSLGSALV